MFHLFFRRMLQMYLFDVAYVSHMLQVFYLDVAKVDLDVAYVVMAIHVCFKCFICFLDVCCKCFI